MCERERDRAECERLRYHRHQRDAHVIAGALWMRAELTGVAVEKAKPYRKRKVA